MLIKPFPLCFFGGGPEFNTKLSYTEKGGGPFSPSLLAILVFMIWSLDRGSGAIDLDMQGYLSYMAFPI